MRAVRILDWYLTGDVIENSSYINPLILLLWQATCWELICISEWRFPLHLTEIHGWNDLAYRCYHGLKDINIHQRLPETQRVEVEFIQEKVDLLGRGE